MGAKSFIIKKCRLHVMGRTVAKFDQNYHTPKFGSGPFGGGGLQVGFLHMF